MKYSSSRSSSRALLFALASFILLVHVFAQDDTTTTTTTKTTTTTTTTPSPPETTTITTTTTTEEPPTTKSTTTTTTTTPDPSTTNATTTPSPSTTPAPTPAPPKWPNNIHLWNVVDTERNITCIKLEGAIKLDVTYEAIDRKNASAGIDVPVSANSSGVCGKKFQSITLTWDVLLNNTTSQNKLEFNFEFNDSNTKDVSPEKISPGKYALVNVTFLVYQDKAHFPNTSNIDKPLNLALDNLKFFETKLNHSYFCRSLEQYKNNGFGFEIEQTKIEAFRTQPSNATEFSAANVCKLDDTTDVVPIAIGASLAGLVVFILIIYLIGRRKSRARGYQSV